MLEAVTYRVLGMGCTHCTTAVESRLKALPGVETAVADLETKLVTVTGNGLDDAVLRGAIDEAGYEAE
jgi:copper chaperone CopZ